MFTQFLSRLWRIAQANEAAARGSGNEMQLREAEALIEESRRRDEPRIDIPEPKARPGSRSDAEAESQPDSAPSDPAPLDPAPLDPAPLDPVPGEMTYERAIAILRVRQGATMEEVTSAYRKIIIEHHPDRNSHLDAVERSRSEARTRELNGAYAFLKDYFSHGT